MSGLGPRLNDLLISLLAIEHRFDPHFRGAFDRVFQRPLTDLVQWCLRHVHANPETALCQEIALPGEEELTDAVIRDMTQFIQREYKGTTAERAGNTKTYGVVSGEFVVHDRLDAKLCKGIFAAPRSYPVWVRFAGPGPLWPPDVRDNGILSIGIKLMGVTGPRCRDDEQATQDFTGISCPTFTTPNVAENVKLQRNIGAGTPAWYFLNPFDSHYLDFLMQGIYSRMNTSPLEVRYWSCVPYLLGEGQAMKYAVRPRSSETTRVPWSIPDNWLRQAMRQTLDRKGVEFDFLLQLQTDVRRMPIEDASIEWPEALSPFVPVATLRIPAQTFDTPERTLLARELAWNPWHALADHRPLGNQGRARLRIYESLARARQAMNREPIVEPSANGTTKQYWPAQ